MITLREIVEKQKQDQSFHKVAICVTSYNQRQYIDEALQSLLGQKTDFPFVVIVGDDHSTDGSVELLNEYQKKYPDIIKVLFSQENHGLFYNRRQIFLNCSAPYVAFCDGDDYWIDENCLQKKYDFLESHLNYIGYQTACYTKTGNEVSQSTDLQINNCFFDFDIKNARNNDYPGQVGGFFFRNIYRYMSKEDFEEYTNIPIDDSGKLPIVAGMIAPIYRQDKTATFMYRFHNSSMERQKEKTNMCQKLFLSHLQYESMIENLFNNEIKMNLHDQMMQLVVNAFVTALKSGVAGKTANGDWKQFIYLYNYGYFEKKEIRHSIRRFLMQKIRSKGMQNG